jgi:hypothetical protein
VNGAVRRHRLDDCSAGLGEVDEPRLGSRFAQRCRQLKRRGNGADGLRKAGRASRLVPWHLHGGAHLLVERSHVVTAALHVSNDERGVGEAGAEVRRPGQGRLLCPARASG